LIRTKRSRYLIRKKLTARMIFPGSVLIIYFVLFLLAQDRAMFALKASYGVFLRILVPLAFVFILMFLMNLFIKPPQIAGLIGKESGVSGVLFSIGAGIVSTGPIFAWYPLLEELKKRGARESLIAIFLNNRAVKPVLIPVMVSYFGWVYVALLTALTILGSLACGSIISIAQRK